METRDETRDVDAGGRFKCSEPEEDETRRAGRPRRERRYTLTQFTSREKQSRFPFLSGVHLLRGGRSVQKKSSFDGERSTPTTRTKELERAAAIRKAHGIKTTPSSTTPCPLQSFEEIEEKTPTLNGLASYATQNGFPSLTPIQMQAIPVLCQERDVISVAPTGSGKTLAFLIPILVRITRIPEACIQVLVVSPTCELSTQSYRTFLHLQTALNRKERLSAFLLDKASRKKLRNRTPDVLFCTPFSLVKQIQKENMNLSHVRFLILDEADRLFSRETRSGEDSADMKHYVAQLDSIVAACQSKELVKAMFSATFPPNVSDLANNFLINPVHITVGKKNVAVSTVRQHLLYTGCERGKLFAIRQILAKGISPPVLIFVDTKSRANALLTELRIDGICAESIHSEIEVHQRDRILRRFRDGDVWILIATDLVSRGIDFVGVHMVVNYDFPKSTTDYIHRIGRSGRAGSSGLVCPRQRPPRATPFLV